MKPRIITVNDKMQRGYRYALVAPTGRAFDPEFRPELTPKEMLELGGFAAISWAGAWRTMRARSGAERPSAGTCPGPRPSADVA